MALIYRRHMHEYGTTSEQLRRTSPCRPARCTRRATRRASCAQPITLADHQASRWIAEPLRLLDCCLESDGACAVVVTSAERAARRSAARRLTSCGRAGGRPDSHPAGATTSRTDRRDRRPLRRQAALRHGRHHRRATSTLRVLRPLQPAVLLSLEDYGFCAPARAGRSSPPATSRGPTAQLPVNTHGGSLSEAYIHGYNHILEGVRQIRGTSTCPGRRMPSWCWSPARIPIQPAQ